MTGAGNLPARHVVHTVGPVWGTVPAEEAVDLLASCYRNSLSLARDMAGRSIAFPNISTGVYHLPKPLAADTAYAAVLGWLEDSPDALDRVLFVCFGPDNLRLYQELLGVETGP